MSALIKSTAAVGSMTLLSRLLGLARDIVIARFFSASDAADAFFVAFKIPNFLRRLFAEGAFSLAFVPVLTEYRSNYSNPVATQPGRCRRLAIADQHIRRGIYRSAGKI
jgi:putative peptidoglycan lipid II flippase